MKSFRVDLHVHTALSPCAENEMTPPAVIEAARNAGLAMIGVCDHNSAGNAWAFVEAARARSSNDKAHPYGSHHKELVVLPGLEVTTAEEVHVLALFGDVDSAMRITNEIEESLPAATGDYYQKFGDQVLLQADGKTIGKARKMLACASRFSLSTIVKRITNGGGIAVASHTNRPSFSVLSQLGRFPADVKFDAIELTAQRADEKIMRLLVGTGFPMVASSDSHRLSDIGTSHTVVEMRDATFDELRLALRSCDGRAIKERVFSK